MSTVLTIQILVYISIIGFGCGLYGYRSGYRDGFTNGKRAAKFQVSKTEAN